MSFMIDPFRLPVSRSHFRRLDPWLPIGQFHFPHISELLPSPQFNASQGGI